MGFFQASLRLQGIPLVAVSDGQLSYAGVQQQASANFPHGQPVNLQQPGQTQSSQIHDLQTDLIPSQGQMYQGRSHSTQGSLPGQGQLPQSQARPIPTSQTHGQILQHPGGQITNAQVLPGQHGRLSASGSSSNRASYLSTAELVGAPQEAVRERSRPQVHVQTGGVNRPPGLPTQVDSQEGMLLCRAGENFGVVVDMEMLYTVSNFLCNCK